MASSNIAFVSDRDGSFDIFVMNADGTDQTNLTRTADWEEDHPAWSPDGSRIAYCSRHAVKMTALLNIFVLFGDNHS